MAGTTTRERPILFSGAMVSAILAGRKTQTRRILTPQPTEHTDREGRAMLRWRGSTYKACQLWADDFPAAMLRYCPYGAVGQHLWVREGFWTQPALDLPLGTPQPVAYDADGLTECLEDYRKRPSIHMPRWASRLTLEITGVRAERLNAIGEADALAEGIVSEPDHVGPHFGPAPGQMTNRTAYAAFARLWDGINKARGFGWQTNPYVWVVEFRRLEG